MNKTYSAGLYVFLSLVFAASALGQRSISVGSPVTENFDSLGTANITVVNNTTISGLYSERTLGNVPAGNLFTASNGGVGTSFFNYGTTAALDRAPGSAVDTGTGTAYLGMRLRNTGTTPIGSITLAYTGEEWRRGAGAASAPVLNFAYQTGATVTTLTTGAWTPLAALDFVAPNTGGGQSALDGNAAGNRVSYSQTFILSLPVGQEVMLRWAHPSQGGQPFGLGIDDLSVTAIAASAGEATISGRVTDSFGRAIGLAVITVTDFAGASRSVYTNTFGYFSVKGLNAGQSYIVSISARRHTFAEPTRIVSLDDNVTDLRFVALR